MTGAQKPTIGTFVHAGLVAAANAVAGAYIYSRFGWRGIAFGLAGHAILMLLMLGLMLVRRPTAPRSRTSP